MKLHVLPAGPIQTNSYLLTSARRGEAVLIDAPGGVWAKVEPILREENCQLLEIWLTHGHWDHAQGGAEIVRATRAKVRAHEADGRLIENPKSMSAFAGSGIDLEPVKIDFFVTQGEQLRIFGATAEVRHVPGHSPGNVLFHFRGGGAAFVGDALFQGSVGRTDLPGGDAALLAKSIREQIYSLPDKTMVYPGHGPATTVAREKADNPFVRGS
jgi:hydroxyacylglutathione hydrolase